MQAVVCTLEHKDSDTFFVAKEPLFCKYSPPPLKKGDRGGFI